MFGQAGTDGLSGGNGNDRLFGGIGNDGLAGGAGADLLDGGVGGDFMAGGTGNDTYIVDNVRDRVQEFAGGGIDTVRSSFAFTALGPNVENLTMLAGAVSGLGNVLNNVMIGNGNNNTITAGGGNDSLFGLNGADQLNGGLGNDRLVGGNGNDTLQGDAGRDLLIGGLGADKFKFVLTSDSPSGPAEDLIVDFSRAQGDKIDLSTIDADTTTPGIQHFVFDSFNANPDKGKIGVFFPIGDTDTVVVQGNTDDDAFLEIQFRVRGPGTQLETATLASDYIL